MISEIFDVILNIVYFFLWSLCFYSQIYKILRDKNGDGLSFNF